MDTSGVEKFSLGKPHRQEYCKDQIEVFPQILSMQSQARERVGSKLFNENIERRKAQLCL